MINIDIRKIVLGRCQNLQNCILLDKTDKYVFVRGCLSEALTIAMQLKLMESIEATEIAARVDKHICDVYKVCHISQIY